MHLLLVGLSHRTAPIELRERVDFQGRLEPALRALAARGSAVEAVVLSTCNRAELYAACNDVAAARADLAAFVGDFHGVDRAAVAPHVYDLQDLDAARHLFRVSAGLDSLVVGEPQILGQVKDAHRAATGEQTVGPLLNRLFHFSFFVGKRVRAETGLAAGAVSVGYAAVALARKIFGALKGRTVLVIGAGEMGKLTARHLKSQGVRHVTIVSRTLAHATRTAMAIGGASAVPWDELDSALGASDIVVTTTGATSPILTKARIEAVMHSRRNRPIFIIDIAVPRDVEPASGELEQVFLYNIDDLQATVRDNLARRASEVERAEAIVSEEVGKFGAWFKSRGVIPTVVALRQRFEAIRRSELERLDFKLGALPPEARARVDEITHLIVEKLLLTPTAQLKGLGDAETATAYSEALSRLFRLSDAADRDSAEAQPEIRAADPDGSTALANDPDASTSSGTPRATSSGERVERADPGEDRVQPFIRPKARPTGPGR
ncbi:MAG: glutamyl-tRNA reductase [Acidobacteria bacterium RIFCSPLOWO2_12_FULL_65_11]|nr:MAG: glutamyl-tRNA reductase [Acidobacteria bacterium RIFCSPLOWO2_02_FULL_64_15]OFW31469.1 MAG: glutamyl-tRNA reductase [Acidobacteria bacterium RIFCSPLOWO2_12_FULL_65_11]